MAVDVAATCEELHEQYASLITQLGALPLAGSVSNKGRSITVQAADIRERLALVAQTAAALGCPIGTMGEPFCITSVARPVRY